MDFCFMFVLNKLVVVVMLVVLGFVVVVQVMLMVVIGSYVLDGDLVMGFSSIFLGSNLVDVLNFLSLGSIISNVGLYSYGLVDGNFGSCFLGFGVYQVNGGFKLVELIINISVVVFSVSFIFLIMLGLLVNMIGLVLGVGQYVEVGLMFDFKVGIQLVWNSVVILCSDSNGIVFFSSGDMSFFVGFGSYYNVFGVMCSVDLGVINVGEIIELSYELIIFVNGVFVVGFDCVVLFSIFIVLEGWYVYLQCGYGYGYGYGFSCGYLLLGMVVEVLGYMVFGIVSGLQVSFGDLFFIQFLFMIMVYSNGSSGNFGSYIFLFVLELVSYVLLVGGLGMIGWVL